MKKIIAYIFVLNLLFAFAGSIAFAQYTGADWDMTGKSTINQPLLNVGKEMGKSGLPGFENDAREGQASVAGAKEITRTIITLTDYIKYITGTLAIIMCIYFGATMVFGGHDDKKIETARKGLTYSLIALFIIFIASTVVTKIIFPDYGVAFKSEASAKTFGMAAGETIKTVYDLVAYFAAGIAILFIIINGIRIAMSFGDQDGQNKAIKRILYSLVGLLVVGLAEFVIKDIIFPKDGDKLPAADVAIKLIKGLTNFASGIVGTVAFVMMLYAGYLYVIGGAGGKDSTETAKKLMIGSIIGLLLAAGAFAIVNTIYTI